MIAGHNNSVNDFSHVVYPGDLRNCETCHVDGSHLLPLPDGLLDTITNWDFFTPTQPIAAACLSCHDGQEAAAHAETMTASFGESCSACHGQGKEAAVEKVHAQ